ncbi:TonB-dependent receptor [Ravibacter arvi]|uniref:TonB-dependent receptor n=1 Tax=Ravibacter arvi TaxID=2051041 RepID=A0ABP8LQH5_9BACT
MNSLRIYIIFSLLLIPAFTHGQQKASARWEGRVKSGNNGIPFASVSLIGTSIGTLADSAGFFKIEKVPPGSYEGIVSAVGYQSLKKKVTFRGSETVTTGFDLASSDMNLDEVVVTGTMKEVSKLDSPVPVDIVTPKFLAKNPTPSIFEGLSYVNGIRPQINCSVCNTGDIHINGLEGPYTMVLVDGVPIVSGLATVYGLTGIPNSLIERIEIVKGPASTLYGSEAVGGLINIITRDSKKAPVFTADVFATGYQEYNADLGAKLSVGKRITSLFGVNYFNYQRPVDKNGDGFTDLTLQHRVSVFNKWQMAHSDGRVSSLAVRYFNEDRWGGQMNWNRRYRGGTEVYGESIYTRRFELIGAYQLPFKEKVTFQYSFNTHHQNSAYGNTPYNADQKIAFGQFLWDKTVGKHSILVGTPFRYTFYNDNTPATATADLTDKPSETFLPGIFVQDEITFGKNTLLLGARYDYNSIHGNIFTPRIAWKQKFGQADVLRLNIGRGYRVVNLFTEEHSALTGAREVVIMNELKPEQSWNANLNYVKKIVTGNSFLGVDAALFYTHFTNRILPDYDTDPQKIIYNNLEGYAVSRGISLNLDYNFTFPLKISAGATLSENFFVENGVKTIPVLTERIMGVGTLSYDWERAGLTFDYTANVYGPMRLPLLGPDDPRAEYSPVWSIQNIQLTKSLGQKWEVYGGVKNLLNFRPPANSIARPFDPFNKNVAFDANGDVLATPDNPHRLIFDPSYVYASNQGIRGFLGIRYTLP